MVFGQRPTRADGARVPAPLALAGSWCLSTSLAGANGARGTKATSDDYHCQSLVDLVMWIDVSKSALIFGIGTFITISSSYTQDPQHQLYYCNFLWELWILMNQAVLLEKKKQLSPSPSSNKTGTKLQV
ncbi:hypothetical protein V6N11_062679 [Hibiscus sabdariffa]|uniref:Uncharacterized protein n=1 Tax=Hibiscus sabdariffa TaxID=183260 RepID=A0ABR2PT91_9ROSI